ncbi:sugar kinase [Chryseobacterium sp. Leaf404]|uniref:ribokinase n=1 Tax=unclassified Chryseobacterium TaxID=2593645 RepID=UPI0006F576E5|nr:MULTISPECIES: ribokinase [unclassified Chryseobacterium]KQT16886.1 sugar kinase [Chryseobacterium sp. Leaf404]
MNFSKSQPKVIVIGSCFIDQMVTADRLPKPNESVSASRSEFFFGGKGANQAVGMSRLGAQVYFIGCVGMDPAGQQIMRNLVKQNVNVGFVAETDLETTGSAFITKTGNDYSVVFIPAANQCLTPQNIDAADKYIRESDMVLLQLEISDEILKHAVLKAKVHHKTVGLYASPARKIDQMIIDQADFIIARSTELSLIFGSENLESVLEKYSNKLFVRDETNATVYHNGSVMKYQRDENETMKYQIGMGDGFTCGFAYAFAHGNSLEDCVKLGNRVSAKVSLKTGAQTGLPYLDEIL